MGDDTQQGAAGRTQTGAAAKDSAYMGHTLLLGELEVTPCFLIFKLYYLVRGARKVSLLAFKGPMTWCSLDAFI